jgi:hypothetical protein
LLKRKLKSNSKVWPSDTLNLMWLLAPLPPPESILTTALRQLTQIRNHFNSVLTPLTLDSTLYPTIIWQTLSETKYQLLGQLASNRRTLTKFSGTHPKDNTKSLSISTQSELIQLNRHYNLVNLLLQSTKEVPVI